MYGEGQGVTTVPAVVATGVGVTVLPATGMDSTVSLAMAILAGLITWGTVYYLRAVRVKR